MHMVDVMSMKTMMRITVRFHVVHITITWQPLAVHRSA